MNRFLKSTTSLTLCLSLGLPPGLAMAQDAAVQCDAMAAGQVLPCVLEDGALIETEEQYREFLDAAEDGKKPKKSKEAAAEGDAKVEADAGAGAGAAVEKPAGKKPKKAKEAAGNADAGDAPGKKPAGEKKPKQKPAAEVTQDVAPAGEAADQKAQKKAAKKKADGEKKPGKQAKPAEAVTDAGTAGTAAPGSEAAAVTAGTPAVPKAAEAQAGAKAPKPAQPKPAAEAGAQQPAPAPAKPAATAKAPQPAPAKPAATAKAPQPAPAKPAATAQAPAPAPAKPVAEAGAQQPAQMTEAEKAKLKKERRAARQAAKKAAAAAGGDAAEAGATVSTEKLTQENTRSSSEEFDTSVTGKPAAAAQAAKPKDDDKLSPFEKALLLGLGAVVVGTILNNGDEVISRSDDRVVVERDGELKVLKNDDALLRQPGADVRTETFRDGSTRTIVDRPDGSQIVTIRSADGAVLSRTRITPEGEAIVLFDDTAGETEVVVSELPKVQLAAAPRADLGDQAALRRALAAAQGDLGGRRFSLRQVRDIPAVRALAPEIELDAIRFETGSAAIRPEQAQSLARIGGAIRAQIAEDPRSVLLIEGHTDAVGSDYANLALSDRRAESVALALSEYFDVPPENMIVQGYGESALKVPTEAAEPANRRAVVRNITGLLR